MKKNILIIIIVLVILVGGIYLAFISKKQHNNIKTTGVLVVPTFVDKIDNDAAWCATFNLIWNDLKDDLVKQDINFNKNNTYVDNLNKELFKESDISNDYYYKVYGKKTLELKSEIEKNIKDKFNQTSDILDKFDWSEDALDNNSNSLERYIFYTMLYREFKYKTKFVKLDEDKFNDTKNIKYFGVKDNKESYKNQINIIYYNNEDDFAIKLTTTSNDEIIINKNPKGDTFEEIYNNIITTGSKYKANKEFTKSDNFKMPYINLNVLKEYNELENKEFYDKDNNTLIIDKAPQTIKFELNENGGKIKSEAGMDVVKFSSLDSKEESRNLNVNKTFAIFLKEDSKDKPYFAARIDDITKYQ